MKVKVYCKCGASMVGTIEPDKKAKQLIAIFWETHNGSAHSSCLPQEAYKARYKEERCYK